MRLPKMTTTVLTVGAFVIAAGLAMTSRSALASVAQPWHPSPQPFVTIDREVLAFHDQRGGRRFSGPRRRYRFGHYRFGHQHFWPPYFGRQYRPPFHGIGSSGQDGVGRVGPPGGGEDGPRRRPRR